MASLHQNTDNPPDQRMPDTTLPPSSEPESEPAPPRRESLISRYLDEAGDLDRAAEEMWVPESRQTAPNFITHRLWRRRFQHIVADIIWNARLLWRWERPRAKKQIEQQTAPVKKAAVFSYDLALGQVHWAWRHLKNDPELRLTALQVMGGLSLSVLLFVAWLSLGRPGEEKFLIDPTVPAPAADILDVAEEVSAAVPGPQVTPLPEPEPLSQKNFRFEYFVAREANSGKIKLYNHTAENYVKSWFAPGTPAKPFMIFLSSVLQRSIGKDVKFPDRCMRMPVNKVFRESVVTCTYAHTLPGPFKSKGEKNLRAFWIVSLSYDAKLNIRDVRLHARLVPAAR